LETAKFFRQKYCFYRQNQADPYLWTFSHTDHVHFVLYQGTTIVGYTHLQKQPHQRAVMRIIVVDQPFRNQGLGSQLLALSEQWLKAQGYGLLQVESNSTTGPFYRKHGYTDMLFDDSDGHKSRPGAIPLGKRL
jgi:GNAT superfamily N-acetyltransferase